MGSLFSRRGVPIVAGLLGLLALVSFSAPAMAGNVTACGDFSGVADTRFDIVNNIPVPAGFTSSDTCLIFHERSVIFLNGHTITGLSKEYPNTIGIHIANKSGTTYTTAGNAFIWGPGTIRHFGQAIVAGDDVAVENVLVQHTHVGINLGDSYKVKEVRVRNCTTSQPDDTGITLGKGGFIESSMVRDCEWGVKTGQNNKIWNLVVSKHLYGGLVVGAGNAVSRTVISSPRSNSTYGIDYRLCTNNGGCQDGSNSVQDHCVAALGGSCGANPLNILVTLNASSTSDVITDGATNCGGDIIPYSIITDKVTSSC